MADFLGLSQESRCQEAPQVSQVGTKYCDSDSKGHLRMVETDLPSSKHNLAQSPRVLYLAPRLLPRPSMYDLVIYIEMFSGPNVGRYFIHGVSG